MVVTVADLCALMKDAGIKDSVIAGLNAEIPLVSQGLDSIDIPVLAAALEKKYGVSLANVDSSKTSTLNNIVAFLNA